MTEMKRSEIEVVSCIRSNPGRGKKEPATTTIFFEHSTVQP